MSLNFFIPFVFFSRLVSLFCFAPLVLAILETYPANTSTTSLSILCSVYGITQALFQYPWARLSDFISRLLLIRIILIVFTIASLGCYFSSSAEQLIFFRALQGSCALQALVQAYLSDYLNPDQLKRSMLFVGLAVTLALFIGYSSPLIISIFSFSPQLIFLISALLSWCAFLGSFTLTLPTKTHVTANSDQGVSIYELNLYPFIINFLTHFIHSFLLISSSLALGASSSNHYCLLLFIALIIASPALSPSRPSLFILKFCSSLVFISIISFYILTLEYFIYLSLLINFSLLLILEASIPSILVATNYKYPKGSLMGINAFIQYISMSLGFYLAPFASSAQYSWLVFIGSYCILLSILVLFTSNFISSSVSKAEDY